jgi:hypothetical protein
MTVLRAAVVRAPRTAHYRRTFHPPGRGLGVKAAAPGGLESPRGGAARGGEGARQGGRARCGPGLRLSGGAQSFSTIKFAEEPTVVGVAGLTV